jgi:hypothetical protein
VNVLNTNLAEKQDRDKKISTQMTLGHGERGESVPVPKQSIHEIPKSATLTQKAEQGREDWAVDTLAEWIVPKETTVYSKFDYLQ